MQALIVSVVICVMGALGFTWIYRARTLVKGRRNIATLIAQASGGAMLVLVVLRLISLHAIDRVLYGTFKINWIGDVGTSLLVLAAAAYYVNLFRPQSRAKGDASAPER